MSHLSRQRPMLSLRACFMLRASNCLLSCTLQHPAAAAHQQSILRPSGRVRLRCPQDFLSL